MHTSTRIAPKEAKRPTAANQPVGTAGAGTGQARDEILAYVAIRDLLLHDAEVTTTAESLRRAAIANEFVETCLEPARAPYDAQYLHRVDAARERERCGEVRAAIAGLRQKL